MWLYTRYAIGSTHSCTVLTQLSCNITEVFSQNIVSFQTSNNERHALVSSLDKVFTDKDENELLLHRDFQNYI